MDDSGQPGDAPGGGGGNPPASRDPEAWADRDRDSGTRSAWHRSRYANLLTPIVPASRQPRQQVNGSSEVHSTSAPPYPYEGDLEDAAHSPIPTQAHGEEQPPWPAAAAPPAADGDPDWRGWAPPPGADEALPEPPSPWAPGWAPAPTDGGVPEVAPPAPPAPPAGGAVGPFAVAFPPAPPRFDEPAPPPVRFRPRQDEPPRPAGDGQQPAPADGRVAPAPHGETRRPDDTDPATGGFPPIGAVAAGAPTEHVPPGTPTEADPYPAGFRPSAAGPTAARPDWAPEWPWSPAPPAPTSPAGRIQVPAPRPDQPAEPSPAGPMPEEGSLPSRRGFTPPTEPPHRNTLPGYIRGGEAPSGDGNRFITGSHPTVAPHSVQRPAAPEPTGGAATASGGFPVVESAPGRVERTASGSFPVVDRRSAGLSRSFPAGEQTDPPVTPGRLTRAFPGGDGPPAAPQATPSTGAFPGGGDRVSPTEPVSPAGANRPTDLSGRQAAAQPPAPVSPAAAGPRDDAQVRPPLRLASRNGDPIGNEAVPPEHRTGQPEQPAERPTADRFRDGATGDVGGQRGFPGEPTSGPPAGAHQSGFPAGDGARRGFGGGDPSDGDPTGGGFARGFAGDQGGGGTRAASGFAAERANGGFGGEPANGAPGGTTNGGFGDEPPIPLHQRPIDRPAPEQRSVVDDMIDELSGLPQRVPAEPDVPTVPEPPSDAPADPPQLARIATHLRRPDLPEERERPDGFDVDAILDAVRGVSGVKGASLRQTPAGAHSLRLDLADGADAADVSRHVARLLQERMGLAAAPQNLPGMAPPEAPLGGDTPPTGFSRTGGYLPPPPVERAPEATRPAPRPVEAARQAPRPPEPPRLAPRPADATRPAPRPADVARPAPRPADAIRPVPRPADATKPRPAEPTRPAVREAEPTRPATRPTDVPAAQISPAPAPPGFEPPAEQDQNAPGSHRGRAHVGSQSGVDTRDLAERAAAAASAAPVSAAPASGLPQRTEPAAHRPATDSAERGHLYGGTRESDPRTGSDQPASGSFPELGSAAGIIGNVGGHPVMAAATAYSGGQITTTESAPSRPLNPGANPGPRVVIDHVQVSTFGLDATVETRLAAGKRVANGLATGPAVDGYVLRLCAVSAATAIDELLRTASRADDRGRCFVEHAAVVPFGNCEVAVVVVFLVCGGWVEQLAGSALVSGDPRQAVVRATLAAVNRRLEALLSD
ncbi:hypothetical protein Ais01nite_37550 [Asanoa ishikariensis]|uniref:hypothetical protein n=1 Tax=Asanoa ishikariensis TaxID=137265 RepID=UPI001A57AE23|nr:hypothetical protein Ais01nite_37550 [Asanoa ishikariensis]